MNSDIQNIYNNLRRMQMEEIAKPTRKEWDLYKIQRGHLKNLVNLIADLLDGDESKREELRKFILIDTNLHEMINE